MKIGKEDLTKFHSLTVGRLKEFINEKGLSDDAPVIVEISDNVGVYYKKVRTSHIDSEIKEVVDYELVNCCEAYVGDINALFLNTNY